MTDNDYQHNLEATCGPAARFSDHKAGETITYHCGNEIRTGEIIYVTAPHEVASMHMPLTYVVDSGRGFPDMVWAPDITE
jgi:hypothetical protein